MVHGGIGCGAYDDDGIRGIAYHDHQHAQQRSVHHARTDEWSALYFTTENESQGAQHDDADEETAPSVTVEGDTQHTDSQQIRAVHTTDVFLNNRFAYGPQHGSRQADDVADKPCVERHAQRVDEEQFEPSAYFNDARHNAVQNGCHQNE